MTHMASPTILIDVDDLANLLKLLRYYDVSEFESGQYKIKLNPIKSEAPEGQQVSSPPVARKEPPKTMWHNSSLWPQGKPPEFPK